MSYIRIKFGWQIATLIQRLHFLFCYVNIASRTFSISFAWQ